MSLELASRTKMRVTEITGLSEEANYVLTPTGSALPSEEKMRYLSVCKYLDATVVVFLRETMLQLAADR